MTENNYFSDHATRTGIYPDQFKGAGGNRSCIWKFAWGHIFKTLYLEESSLPVATGGHNIPLLFVAENFY